ncbi:uncharacterized protein LOC134841455 [Symsagittifera roscoffensis]|uniref:uncharacterized protein LOC134841455 n=1 Tax=Symsagittifera roscoffensis TaxID=84072 RepID=UPI00307C302A
MFVMCPFDSVQAEKKCGARCKPQCGFTKYKMDKTWSEFPNRRDFRQIRGVIGSNVSVDYDYARKNLGMLTVHMASFTTVDTIVSAKYELFSASSAVGGLLGLLIGGSMVTFVEIADFILVITGNFFITAWTMLKPSSKVTSQ